MRLFVGTSGYSYKEWKGSFYPDKLPQKEMLRYYAERFSTVEVNNTFYRLPEESVVKSWAEQVPESFLFVLKARQVITHFKRLQGVEKETDDFLRVADVLGEKLGPILFQLPPNFKKDVERLDAFLRFVGGRAKVTFEFRHESWFDAEVFDCLRTHSVSLCIAESQDTPKTELIGTTNWGYLRLREVEYSHDQLSEWACKIAAQNWNEVYLFFKHEDTGTGPQLACQFIELAKKHGFEI
jgi:uncharacterized protein YecE (DUF72 family)